MGTHTINESNNTQMLKSQHERNQQETEQPKAAAITTTEAATAATTRTATTEAVAATAGMVTITTTITTTTTMTAKRASMILPALTSASNHSLSSASNHSCPHIPLHTQYDDMLGHLQAAHVGYDGPQQTPTQRQLHSQKRSVRFAEDVMESRSTMRRRSYTQVPSSPPTSPTSTPTATTKATETDIDAIAKADIWYNREDFSRMRQDNRETVKQMKNLVPEDIHNDVCYRGLEYPHESRQRQEEVHASIEVVLDEQDRQHDLDINEPDVIAQMYGFYTRACQSRAVRQGARDAVDCGFGRDAKQLRSSYFRSSSSPSVECTSRACNPPVMPIRRSIISVPRDATLPCAYPRRTTDYPQFHIRRSSID